MKKLLLSALMLGGMSFAYSQTAVQVLYPTAIATGFEHSIGDWALTPDMDDPANRVVAPVMIAVDGTADSTLMCNTTSQDLSGHIAILYRGDCEFGLKAKNAWAAGAVGVIIVGHTQGEMINMAAGADGDVVDVPAVFLKKEDGDIIYQALKAGDSVSVLIGNKIGYMPNDLGSIPGYTANVPAQVPVQLAANTTDFPVRFAAQLYNYGANTQHNIYVTAAINKNGSEIYRDTSNVVDSLVSGDSTDQFSFIDYSGNLGLGSYEIIYEFFSDSTDDFPSDNKFVYPFKINDDNLFSYAKYDDVKKESYFSGTYGPADRSGDFRSCITFKDPKASQFGIKGVYFVNGMKDDDTPIDGEEVIIQVYKWKDQFQFGVENPSFNNLEEITGGSYIYMDNNQGEYVYADMQEYVVLENDVTYLVCAKLYNEDMEIGYDNDTKYAYYESIVERYLTPVADGDTWYASGFKGGPMPSMTLRFFPAEELGVSNADKFVDATVYPNPAKDMVNIVVDNFEGNATLTLTDLSGKVVISDNVTVNGTVTVNTSSLTAGMYIVNMKLANGNEVKASVIVE